MYAIIPAIDGVPQVGTSVLVTAASISPTEALAIINGDPQPGWVVLTEEEYLAAGGTIPESPPTQESLVARIAQLEAVIDALLTGGETP